MALIEAAPAADIFFGDGGSCRGGAGNETDDGGPPPEAPELNRLLGLLKVTLFKPTPRSSGCTSSSSPPARTSPENREACGPADLGLGLVRGDSLCTRLGAFNLGILDGRAMDAEALSCGLPLTISWRSVSTFPFTMSKNISTFRLASALPLTGDAVEFADPRTEAAADAAAKSACSWPPLAREACLNVNPSDDRALGEWDIRPRDAPRAEPETPPR